MPQLFKKITGIILLIAYCFANFGCATLFNSVNFKNAPRDSFVKIEVLTDEYASTGSGVIIHHLDNLNTIILTAGHICKPNTIMMRILDLDENGYGILSFTTAKEDDLCLIVVDGMIPGRALKVADNPPEIGEHVYNIAAPRSIHAPNMSLMFDGYYQGRIGISEEKYYLDVHNIPGMGGSSGSPIFNDNWEIIGIVSRGMPEFQHIMLAINQSRVKKFYNYALTDQFKVDFKKSIDEQNQRLLDFITKMMLQ